MYDYRCEYCDGIVREKIVKKEVFKHKNGFIMLEHVPIGICDNCRYRYYHSNILKKVDDIAEGRQKVNKTETIPVAEAQE